MTVKATIAVAVLSASTALTLSPSQAEESRCRIGAAKLEQTIARKPELREGANAQTVRDLRTLREAAIVLQSYKHESECAQVIAALKNLAADPERAIASGDTDEGKAEALDKVKAPKATSLAGTHPTERETRPAGAKP
jgi:hypothetical protein